ncbi:helix-turn-helix domain-containing protein, partial [Streptomyces sp. NPDC127079]|uniref:MmyB family transcriptional regulator n=1 Tax=Streptomyces sp. NPDC127079 TaxID=3347132 RepID=UPI00366137D9
MDREELAAFLRSRRERISPAEVGLPRGPRRRTPGLRREEVAQLAFISTEYYTRLEQARGPRPSREVLGGLTRALRLSDAERSHLHHLAGAPPGPPPGPAREVRQSLLDLLRRLPQAAAFVTSATFEVLAWNDLAAALMEDFSALPPRERNLVRRAFLGPRLKGSGPYTGDRLYGVSDVDAFARLSAQRLRAAAARYPDSPEVTGLVGGIPAGGAGGRGGGGGPPRAGGAPPGPTMPPT